MKAETAILWRAKAECNSVTDSSVRCSGNSMTGMRFSSKPIAISKLSTFLANSIKLSNRSSGFMRFFLRSRLPLGSAAEKRNPSKARGQRVAACLLVSAH